METLFAQSDKSIVLKAFNQQFFEFLDDIVSIYPENVEILTARETFGTFKRMNPTSLIKVWYARIYMTYREQIEAGNIDFFMEKDYGEDLNNSDPNNMRRVLEMIDKVRGPLRDMGPENRSCAVKYIKNLSKLSVAYANLS